MLKKREGFSSKRLDSTSKWWTTDTVFRRIHLSLPRTLVPMHDLIKYDKVNLYYSPPHLSHPLHPPQPLLLSDPARCTSLKKQINPFPAEEYVPIVTVPVLVLPRIDLKARLRKPETSLIFVSINSFKVCCRQAIYKLYISRF